MLNKNTKQYLTTELNFLICNLKNFLNNDPGKAITFAGVLLLIAAGATMLIKTKKVEGEVNMPMGGGGH